jgi:hypothetical protein
MESLECFSVSCSFAIWNWLDLFPPRHNTHKMLQARANTLRLHCLDMGCPHHSSMVWVFAEELKPAAGERRPNEVHRRRKKDMDIFGPSFFGYLPSDVGDQFNVK